jgi:Tol biopolymer transport system component
LPDGKHFLFFATNHSGDSEQGIYLGSLADGSYRHIVNADSGGQYASGYLLYHLQSALLAQKFDPASGSVSGEPLPVANSVEYDLGTWHGTFASSQNGILVYEPGTKALGADLVWIDRSGKNLGKVAERAFYKGSGQFSPDGKRLALSVGDPQADIWVFDIARGTRTRLTFGGATHLGPSWSADGQKVVYVKQSGATLINGTSLCSRLANGGGQEEVLMQGDPSGPARTLLSPQWSQDGKYLVHMEQSGPSGGIWALPTTGDKKPISILQPPSPQARIIQYRLSPDGRWLAYSSTESGREEVYVTHFPSAAGRWQVSQTGGTFPVWRADSKEILFLGLDGIFQVASVSTKSAEFELEQVRPLFQMNYTSPLGTPYDTAPDGQRFVFATYPESVSTPLVLVTNWTSDLRK